MSQELVRLSKLPVQCLAAASGVINNTQSCSAHIHASTNDVVTPSQTVNHHSSSGEEDASNHGDEGDSSSLTPCNGGEETREYVLNTWVWVCVLGDGGWWYVWESLCMLVCVVCVCVSQCVYVVMFVCEWVSVFCVCVCEKGKYFKKKSIQREMWVPHMNNKETKSVYIWKIHSLRVLIVCMFVYECFEQTWDGDNPRSWYGILGVLFCGTTLPLTA